MSYFLHMPFFHYSRIHHCPTEGATTSCLSIKGWLCLVRLVAPNVSILTIKKFKARPPSVTRTAHKGPPQSKIHVVSSIPPTGSLDLRIEPMEDSVSSDAEADAAGLFFFLKKNYYGVLFPELMPQTTRGKGHGTVL